MRLTARGPAAPAVVWERYADLSAWPSWSPQLRSVTAAGPQLVAGLTGRVHGPLGLTLPFRVLAVDPVAREWTWQVLGLPLAHGVQPAPGGGAAAWLELPVLAAPYVPLALLALGRLVRP